MSSEHRSLGFVQPATSLGHQSALGIGENQVLEQAHRLARPPAADQQLGQRQLRSGGCSRRLRRGRGPEQPLSVGRASTGEQQPPGEQIQLGPTMLRRQSGGQLFQRAARLGGVALFQQEQRMSQLGIAVGFEGLQQSEQRGSPGRLHPVAGVRSRGPEPLDRAFDVALIEVHPSTQGQPLNAAVCGDGRVGPGQFTSLDPRGRELAAKAVKFVGVQLGPELPQTPIGVGQLAFADQYVHQGCARVRGDG